jgi:glycosyltransferase involved in cell wall biosynthesis
MRIGIDASCWLNRRGFGRYTRELVRALLDVDRANEYVLFLDDTTARDADELPAEQRAARVVIHTSAAATRAAAADGSRSLGDLWRMRQAVAKWNGKLDVFYFPADYTYFPINTTAKVIVTKHDMTDRRVPHMLFPSWRSRFLWEAKIRLAIRRSDLVFTVSETSRRDIVAAFGLGPDRVRVVADAVDPVFVPSPDSPERTAVLARYGFQSRERFVLYVGGISPHKNLDTLVLAYERWRKNAGAGQEPVSLALVGDYVADVFHSSYPAIRAVIESAGLGSSVRFMGYVPDADLRHLYSAADALVLPSFYEGFGLPVVESMACGTPVIASNAGALPEVVGSAGLLFDPHSSEELAAVLGRVLSDASLRRDLSARGKARAAEFTWEASARAALSAFEELAR